jgi:hypothetical protein
MPRASLSGLGYPDAGRVAWQLGIDPAEFAQQLVDDEKKREVNELSMRAFRSIARRAN